jgi:hypothetical protein
MNADKRRCFWERQITSTVRGELVEPHLRLQNQLITNQPFDKLRASGGLLDAPKDETRLSASVSKQKWLKTLANKGFLLFICVHPRSSAA